MPSNLPDDFVPENSDVMSPEDEYELLHVLESIDPNDALADFVEAERPDEAQYLETPEDLDRVPIGTTIDDQGLRAVKTSSGAWLYDDGQFWEPGLPAQVVDDPEPR